MNRRPVRTLPELTDEELLRGINYYEWKVLGRVALGRYMTQRDRELVAEWQTKIDIARAELKRRQPKQVKLL